MHKTEAMQLITHDHPQICQSQTTHKNCGSTGGEVELACGCKMPVIAGAVSPDGQRKLENWRNQETPCCVGRVNGVEVIALRDT